MALLYLVIALVQIGLLGVTARLGRRAPLIAGLVGVVLIALLYDNLVLAAGGPFGEAAWLETANVGRYVAHAIAVPLLIPVGVLLAGRLGVRSCSRPAVLVAAWAAAAALILLGGVTELAGLELEPVAEDGIVRYVSTHRGPPIGAILAMLGLLATGVAIWRRARWPWLFAGALIMFVAAGAMAVAGWLGNVGEVALVLGILATLRTATDVPAAAPAKEEARPPAVPS
jgi:hypothetical protein